MPPGLLLVVILRVSVLLAVLTAAHGDRLREALYGAVCLVVYVAVVLVFPTCRCRACWGRMAVLKGQRMVPCKRCHMTGRTKRFGAALVHRVFWRVAGNALMDRRKANLADVRKQRREMGAEQ
jgi:hypothetical protein